MCSEITIRAFSQKIFTHKSLKDKTKRADVKKAILQWLAKEVDPGIGEVLEQIYNEARALIIAEKEDVNATKRKLCEKSAILDQVPKKTKKN